MYINPSELRYAQDSIKWYFQDGCTLEETLRHLLQFSNPANVLKPLRVMRHNDHWFVGDGNRRLLLFKLLEEEGLVEKVKVYVTSFQPEKYTTVNNGTSIKVRGHRDAEYRLRQIIRNRHDVPRPSMRSASRPPVSAGYDDVSDGAWHRELYDLSMSSATPTWTTTGSVLTPPRRTYAEPKKEEKDSSWGCTIL